MEEEGLAVTRALWSIGFSVLFFHFSQQKLQAHENHMSGVRLVFMDINLVGGAFGDGAPAFAAVEQTLRTLLSPSNGPYVLATWSAHDEAAEALFAQLRIRLPPELRPVRFVRIQKEDFIGADPAELEGRVRGLIADLGNVKVLIEWEAVLLRAAGNTVNELLALARKANAANPDIELGTVLRALADAEASVHLTEQNAFRSAGTVLNSILSDVVEQAPELNNADCGTKIFQSPVPGGDPAWKHRLNRFLLVERTAGGARHAPGDVFLYPTPQVQEQGVGHAVDRNQFIVQNFVLENRRARLLLEVNHSKPIDKWDLILIETSPPCDYAENKTVWHRYAVGVELPLADKGHLQQSSLRLLPGFCMEDGNNPRIIAISARLIVTVSPNKTEVLGQRRYRLRERVVTDLNGWISAQQMRQGYVFVDV